MNLRSLPGLFVVACLAWPPSPAVAQAVTARCETIILHGTSDGGVASELPRELRAQLAQAPFSASNTWRSLGRSARTIAASTAFTVDYPNGHSAQVTWEPGTTATRLQIDYRHKRPNGAAGLAPLRVDATWGEWVVGGGPPYQRGVLALAIRCTR